MKDILVSIELFGIQRDIARTGSINMLISEQTLVRDALEYIRQKYPALPLEEDSFLITVNHELATLDRRLRANDIICFLPHIGGG
jgi:molybdopterin converting factor small subunit